MIDTITTQASAELLKYLNDNNIQFEYVIDTNKTPKIKLNTQDVKPSFFERISGSLLRTISAK